MFIFNKRSVEYCASYKYLGVTINEFLDYNFTAAIQADSAGRALGSIIAKSIKCGGLPYNVFSMLFDSCCSSISDYGSEIWGFEPREEINKIHLRAARTFLGVPKNTTSSGILAEINWLLPENRTWIRMIRQYYRIKGMSSDRLPRKVLEWDIHLSENSDFRTWYSEVKCILDGNDIPATIAPNTNTTNYIERLKMNLWHKQIIRIRDDCKAKPKLKLYTSIMEFGSTPAYLLKPLSFVQKMFLAKLRLCALPLRIETGRYERPRLEASARLCAACNDGYSVENEEHFIFICKKYDSLRGPWNTCLQKPSNYEELSNDEKLRFILNSSENVKITAQFIINCFDSRN